MLLVGVDLEIYRFIYFISERHYILIEASLVLPSQQRAALLWQKKNKSKFKHT